jgi:hypothetical protein
LWGIESVKKWTAKVISRAVLRLSGSFRAGESRSVRIAAMPRTLLTCRPLAIIVAPFEQCHH